MLEQKKDPSISLPLCYSCLANPTSRCIEAGEQTADYVTASSALPVPRLLEINFAEGFSAARIIPLGDYLLLQESASMRNFFFVYASPRGSIFFATFSPLFTYTRKRILRLVIVSRLPFSLLMFLSRSWLDWSRSRRKRIAIAILSRLSSIEDICRDWL